MQNITRMLACLNKSQVNVLSKSCDAQKSCGQHLRSYSDAKADGSTKNLITQLKRIAPPAGNKISIIGTGAVGMGCAMAILAQNVTNCLCLVDAKVDWCEAERADLLHGSVFLKNPNLIKCGGMEGTKDSHIIVVTAGARPVGGQSRLDVAQATANIIKVVMPPLLEHSPNALFIIASNPADVMTYVAQKVTGLPQERILSSGCHMETARFRYFIAERLNVAPTSVSGYVIGEHGSTAVPLWSSVTVGGALLSRLQPKIGTEDDPEHWNEINESVVKAAFNIIEVKGYTNWAIGLAMADVCRAFFQDSGRILTLATNANGFYGIEQDVFLSLPCVCRSGGISGIVNVPLSEWEREKLKKSAEVLTEVQCSIEL